MISKLSIAALFLPLTLLTISSHGAALLAIGDKFPDLMAKDQHDADYRFKPGTKVVLIAFDMGSAKKTSKILADQGAGFLDEHQAVYVSNIYGMPTIGRYFALPRMRKYPHRIVLADTEHLLDPFPRKKDRVTVIRLNDEALVRSISFWNPEEDGLQRYLK